MRRRTADALGALAAALALGLVAGCSSDDDSPAACAHGVTQDLDAGRFDAALARLDSRACEAAMSRERIELNRAAAYVGKAGYDVADIVLAVLDSAPEDGDRPETSADLALLEALGGLGEPGGLRFLSRANAAYARMMEAFQSRLDEACDAANVDLLSKLQRDACFNSGLLAYARLVRGFDLLLGQELAAFLGLRELDCSNDRNFSGVPDEAEIAACALQARTRLDEAGGVCLEPGTREGEARGGVEWQRIPGVDSVAFFEDGVQFTNVVPIRVTTEPGGTCTGARRDLRLVQPRAERSPEVLVTGGVCETEITRSCAAADANTGCWPCPIPRLAGDGAMTVGDTLLEAVNSQAERILGVVTEADREELRGELDEIRGEFCEEVEGTAQACEVDADGKLLVNRDAIREYLRQ